MSKPKSKSKKVVATTAKNTVANTTKKTVVNTTNKNTKIAPTRSKRRTATANTIAKDPLLFGKQNYILMGIGFGIILLGLALMTGGGMPNPEVWDENIIYGFRRTVLAPFLMLVGLVVEVVAIFKK